MIFEDYADESMSLFEAARIIAAALDLERIK